MYNMLSMYVYKMFDSEFYPLWSDSSLRQKIKNNLNNQEFIKELDVQTSVLSYSKPPNFRKGNAFERGALQKHSNGDIQDVVKLIEAEVSLIEELMSSTDTLLLGDSFASGWRTSRNRKFLAGNLFRFLSAGISADRTRDLFWRLQNGILKHQVNPRKIFISIGTNDIVIPEIHPSSEFEASPQPVFVTIAYLKEIVDFLVSSYANSSVYLFLPYPRKVPSLRDIDVNEFTEQLNMEILGSIKHERLKIILPEEMMNASRQDLTSFLCDDGVHLDANGYKRWSEFIKMQ